MQILSYWCNESRAFVGAAKGTRNNKHSFACWMGVATDHQKQPASGFVGFSLALDPKALKPDPHPEAYNPQPLYRPTASIGPRQILNFRAEKAKS